jgi:hypothetical protein
LRAHESAVVGGFFLTAEKLAPGDLGLLQQYWRTAEVAELMQWMQFAGHTPTILFYISFTLMLYRGSSLDSHLAWLLMGSRIAPASAPIIPSTATPSASSIRGTGRAGNA